MGSAGSTNSSSTARPMTPEERSAQFSGTLNDLGKAIGIGTKTDGSYDFKSYLDSLKYQSPKYVTPIDPSYAMLQTQAMMPRLGMGGGGGTAAAQKAAVAANQMMSQYQANQPAQPIQQPYQPVYNTPTLPPQQNIQTQTPQTQMQILQSLQADEEERRRLFNQQGGA